MEVVVYVVEGNLCNKNPGQTLYVSAGSRLCLSPEDAHNSLSRLKTKNSAIVKATVSMKTLLDMANACLCGDTWSASVEVLEVTNY